MILVEEYAALPAADTTHDGRSSEGPITLTSISRVAKLVLAGAVLALLFGPRLSPEGGEPVRPTVLTAAVLGPTTSDHDSIGPDARADIRVLALSAALSAALFLSVPRRGWFRPRSTEAVHRTRWIGQYQPRRGPPHLPV